MVDKLLISVKFEQFGQLALNMHLLLTNGPILEGNAPKKYSSLVKINNSDQGYSEMTKTTAILSAVFALGVLFATPSFAAPESNCSSTCSGGGSGGYPDGYGPGDIGGGGGSHGKNGGNGGGGGNFNGGGSQREDNYVCVVGPRVQYVVSARACRRLVHAYMSGYGHGGYNEGGHGQHMSRATRMQAQKRAVRSHGAKHYGKKARRGHGAMRVRSGSGNTYNIINHGTINIHKGGAY